MEQALDAPCDRAPADPRGVEERTRTSSAAETSFLIGGMHCAACAGAIEAALVREPGLLAAQVSAAAQVATLRWNPALTTAGRLADAIRRAGYDVTPDTAAAARGARRREARQAIWRLFVSAFCAMQIMMLAAPAYFSGAGDLSPEYKKLLDWGSWFLMLPVMCFGAAPFFEGAWRSLRRRAIGMDVPVALGVAVAFVASTGAAFDPGGAFGDAVYFDSLSMFVAFLLAGRTLEMRARHRAEALLDNATSALPQSVARIGPGGAIEQIDIGQLAVGDLVRVPFGEAFPADGHVVDGMSTANEALLTGESRPVTKGPGDAVVAGSLNLVAPLSMRVEKIGADTRYEAIAALSRAARALRPAVLASADRWAGPFLWGVLLLAALAGGVWSLVDPARTVWVVVSVLIVTCPCALSLAGPSALIAAAGTMSRNGLVLRNLDAIDGLTRFRTLFIDKTGTLTDAILQCTQVRSLDDGDPDHALLLGRRASSLAAWSRHPLSQAIHRSFESDGAAWSDILESAGLGIEGKDPDGRPWRLGAPAWAAPASSAAKGDAQVVLARAGTAVARFAFDERLRDDARASLAALKSQGVRVCLLSGDEAGRAGRIGALLDLDMARGGLSPEDKLRELRAAQARGECVAMIGDGINDAPVLAQADVSFAMGDGAQVARAQADGVLVSNRLADLVRARALAGRSLRIVRQNLAWAALYNACCVPLALFGLLPPWAAGLGMAASSLFVVTNSMRLAR
jgi:Cu2+-exporting ATPase